MADTPVEGREHTRSITVLLPITITVDLDAPLVDKVPPESLDEVLLFAFGKTGVPWIENALNQINDASKWTAMRVGSTGL